MRTVCVDLVRRCGEPSGITVEMSTTRTAQQIEQILRGCRHTCLLRCQDYAACHAELSRRRRSGDVLSGLFQLTRKVPLPAPQRRPAQPAGDEAEFGRKLEAT